MSDLTELIKEVREGNRNTVAGIELMIDELSGIRAAALSSSGGGFDVSSVVTAVESSNAILRSMEVSTRLFGARTLASIVSIKKMIREWIRDSSLDRRESEAELAAQLRRLGEGRRDDDRREPGRESDGIGLFGGLGVLGAVSFAAGAIFETVTKISTLFSRILKIRIPSFGIVDDAFSALGRYFENFKTIGDQIGKGLSKLKAFKGIESTFSGVKSFIDGIKGSFNLGRRFIQVIPKIMGALGTIAKAIGKLLLPVTLVIAAINGIMAGVKAFQSTDGNLFEKILAGAKGFIVGVFDSLIGSLVNGVSWLAGWILKKLGFEELGQAFQDFDITELFKEAIASFTGIFLKLGSKIGLIGKLAGKLAWPITAIIGVFEGIVAGVKAFQSTEGGLLEKIMAGVGGFFIGVYDSVVGSLVNMASDLVGWILKKLGFEELGQAFQDFDMTATMKDLFIKTWTFLGSIVESIPMIFSQSLDFIVSIKDRIVESILGLADRVIGAFTRMYDSIKAKIDSLIPDFLRDDFPPPQPSGDLSEAEKAQRARTAGHSSWAEYEASGWMWKTPVRMKPPETSLSVPQPSSGQRLSEAGNPALRGAVTIVNNNGGNVSNTTTSNQTNNSSANVGPIMTGSAMEM